MEARYHRSMCQQALVAHFSPRALDTIIVANLRQDGIFTGLLGHPEYHFDDHLAPGWAYIEKQRAIALSTLQAEEPASVAWQAFGRLLHAAQDFYSHSNYVRLWAARYPDGQLPPADQINGLDQALLDSPELFAARVYFPLEAITYFKAMRPLARRLLPADSHAAVNLDEPERGPLFPYAIAAAQQQSVYQFEQLKQALTADELARFYDQPPI